MDAPKQLVAVDCVLFGSVNGRLKVLLFENGMQSVANKWSLIGSYVNENETVVEAVNRVLGDTIGLNGLFLEECGTYSELSRCPGSRIISITYFALISLEESNIKLSEDVQAKWFSVDSIPELVLDHNQMVEDALNTLRSKAKYEPLGFELLPHKFSIPQLQTLYEDLLEKSLDHSNFRKKVLSLGVLERLEEKDFSSSKRGANLFRFNKKRFQKLKSNGLSFQL